MENILCFIINGKNLYLEKNIVIFDIPLLFVCIDDSKQRYLVLCSDSEELRYLVAELDSNVIKDMILSKITMKDAFKTSSKIWEVESHDEIEDDVYKVINFINIPDSDLPEDGAYLDFINDDLKKYINNCLEVTFSFSIGQQTIQSIAILNKLIMNNTDNTFIKDIRNMDKQYTIKGEKLCMNLA